MTNRIAANPILVDLVKKAVSDCMAQIDKTLDLVDVIDDDPETATEMKSSTLFSMAVNFTALTIGWVSMVNDDIDIAACSPKQYQKQVERMLILVGKTLLQRHADEYRERPPHG